MLMFNVLVSLIRFLSICVALSHKQKICSSLYEMSLHSDVTLRKKVKTHLLATDKHISAGVSLKLSVGGN